MTQNLAESKKNPLSPEAAERVHTRLAAEEILRNQVPVPYFMVGSSNNFSKKAINLEYFTLKYGIFIILIQFYSYIDIGHKKIFVLFIKHNFLNQITNRKRMIVPVFIILVVVSLIMDLKKNLFVDVALGIPPDRGGSQQQRRSFHDTLKSSGHHAIQYS